MNHQQIISFNGVKPSVNKSVFVAPGSWIVGDVSVDQDSSIWFNVVLRGDVAAINIGARTNIQDGTVIHGSRFNGSTNIGNDVTVGHQATIHACTIEDYAFIGMQATIMDKVIVKNFGFIAAGALVSPGKVIEKGELWAGVPAKKIRDLIDQEIEMIKESSSHYVNLSKKYL